MDLGINKLTVEEASIAVVEAGWGVGREQTWRDVSHRRGKRWMSKFEESPSYVVIPVQIMDVW